MAWEFPESAPVLTPNRCMPSASTASIALIDAFERKKILLEGNGPVLLDTITYRYTGHSPSDSSTYRTEEEIEAWKKFDSIESYKDRLISGGVAEQSEFDAIQESISKRMTKICRLATDDAVSPRIDLDRNPDTIASIMFSNEHREVMEEGREPDVLMPMGENPRVKKISELNRFAYDEKGAKYPALKTYNVRDGLFEAIIDKFYKDHFDYATAKITVTGAAHTPLSRTYQSVCLIIASSSSQFRISNCRNGCRLRDVRRPRDSRNHVCRLPCLLRRRTL